MGFELSSNLDFSNLKGSVEMVDLLLFSLFQGLINRIQTYSSFPYFKGFLTPLQKF